MEEKVQGISTTVSPQSEEGALTKKEIMDLTENINMQALAIEKTLTTEKLLLRDTVKNFEFKFAEFKLEIQNDVESINASLEGKAGMMFDIVNSSSTALANGIVELKSDLNDSINNISQFLATMETTMTSNFEDLETRMVANATKKENEIYDMAKSSSLALETGIAGLTSNWNSTTNNISEILKTMEMNMHSYMTEIEKKMRDEVTKNQSVTQNTLNTLQTSFSSVSTVVSSISYQQTSAIKPSMSSLYSSILSVSSSVSSVSYKQTYTIQPALSSLSSRISSVSSSLSSDSSYMSSRISSLSGRIYEKEKKTVAFSAIMRTADSFYNAGEIINDFTTIIHNTGNFDPGTGIFTTPKPGTYLFAVNIESLADKKAHVVIVINGHTCAEALTYGHSQNGGNTCVIYLHPGNKVWVQMALNNDPKYYIWQHRAQFTGVLID